ncbi:MAG: hypothetical protein QM571_07070 [Micrococcaceae bacterium]
MLLEKGLVVTKVVLEVANRSELAIIPKSGGKFFAVLPFPKRFIMPVAISIAGTKPPESAIRSGLANGISAEVTDKLVT